MSQRDRHGRRARAGPAADAPSTVADAIARAIERPVPEIYPYAKSRGAGAAERARAGLLRSVRQAVRPQAGAMTHRTRPRDASELGRSHRACRLTSSTSERARSRSPTRRPRRRRPRADRRRLGARPAARDASSKDVDLEVFGIAGRAAARAARSRSAASKRSARAFRSTRSATSTSRCRAANRRPDAATAASTSPAIRTMSIEEAARRRDFTINAISWDPLTGEYLDPFDGRGDLERRLLRVVDPRTFRRRQPARAARRAVRRALRLRARRRRRARCAATIPLDDLPAERVWGEIEKLLLRAAAVDRLRAGDGSRRRREAVSGAAGAGRLSAGAGVASRRRRLGAHAAGRSTRRATRIDDLPRPQQIAVMLGAVCHDFGKPATTAFIDGRIRSIDHEEQGVAPAPAFLDRLNVHSIDGYDVRQQVARPRRAASEAGRRGSRCATRSATARSGGSRTRSTSSCWRGVAKSDCLGREPGQLRLHGDGLVSRARARARRRASSAGADPARPPSARARR